MILKHCSSFLRAPPFLLRRTVSSKQASKAGLVCTTTVGHHNSRFKNLVKLLRLPGKKKETSLDLNNQILPSSSAAAIFSTILNRIPKACLQTRKNRHKEENSTQRLFAHEKNIRHKEENSTESLFAHKKKFATKRREFHTKPVCTQEKIRDKKKRIPHKACLLKNF
jgi:hypothetical protein